MHPFLLDMMACPVCQGDLWWEIAERRDGRIVRANARCRQCDASYPVQDGIGLFLAPGPDDRDLWERADSGLMRYLREHPEIGRQLLDTPPADLAPADQFFRTLLLEAQGRYAEAQQAEQAAQRGLYTADYLGCWQDACDRLTEQVSTGDGPVVDLATGRGYWVEQAARQLARPIVATDMSPRVLRRNRERWESEGLGDRISLLAMDTRQPAFRAGGVETLTSNLGLPNISEPDTWLPELRRVVSGRFLAISHFYPEEDDVHHAALHQAGLEPLLFRSSATATFANAGWRLDVRAGCSSTARPTPQGVLLEGAEIDAFPIVETQFEWAILVAS